VRVDILPGVLLPSHDWFCVCTPGTTGPSSGNADCQLCAPGYHQPAAGRQSCVACPRDSYSLAGAASCTACAGGKNNLQEGLGACTCSAGSTEEDGACRLCGPGTYKEARGSAPCTACPHGKSSDRLGALVVDFCVAAILSALNGIISDGPGRYLRNSNCQWLFTARTQQPGRTWLLGPGVCSGTNQNAPFCSREWYKINKRWTRGRIPTSKKLLVRHTHKGAHHPLTN